jgi:hypothetical protein
LARTCMTLSGTGQSCLPGTLNCMELLRQCPGSKTILQAVHRMPPEVYCTIVEAKKNCLASINENCLGHARHLLLVAVVGDRYVLDRGSALHRLGIIVHQVVYLLRQLAAYFDAHFLQFFAGYRIIMGPASLG